jgi:hypothetical protein
MLFLLLWAGPCRCRAFRSFAFALPFMPVRSLRQSFRSFALASLFYTLPSLCRAAHIWAFAVQAWAVLSSALAELLIAGPSLSSSAQNTAFAVHFSALHGLHFALLHVAAPLQSRPLRFGAFAKPRPASLFLCNAGQGCATPSLGLAGPCHAVAAQSGSWPCPRGTGPSHSMPLP